MQKSKQTNLKKIILPTISVLVLLTIWELGVTLNFINPVFLPPPSSVITAFFQEYKYLTVLSIITLSDFACGYILGVLLALFVGFLLGWFLSLSISFSPLFLLMSTIPIVTFLPLFTLWFGLDKAPIILCGLIGAFFPTFMNTMSGVRNVNKKYIEVAHNFHASEFQTLRKVVIPGALPHVINGLRVSVQSTFIITAVAEMIMGDIGLGGYIWINADLFRTEMVILGQLTLGVMGLALYYGVNKIERIVLSRWQSI